MKSIVIFASGSGTTFEYLVDRADNAYQVVALFCNCSRAGVIEKARKRGIRVVLIDQTEAWKLSLRELQPDLIVLAGYLKLIPADIVSSYRIINTHPALLPKFGGPGFYGERVHQAVIDQAETTSGVTVHWVNDAYDDGAIIAQAEVSVSSSDTADSLAAKVQAQEKPLLHQTIIRLLEEI